jgi:ADP-ribose pyrophosphatase YjhB (NUDIX family)
LDQETARLLLVRNQGTEYWYAPGGGWNHEIESIEQCSVRETEEETGIKIYPVRLLYVQEFRPNNGDVHLELFWFAYPTGSIEIRNIKDLHGIVEEARWFSRDELHPLTVFPKRLKDQFWHELGSALTSPNPFLK